MSATPRGCLVVDQIFHFVPLFAEHHAEKKKSRRHAFMGALQLHESGLHVNV